MSQLEQLGMFATPEPKPEAPVNVTDFATAHARRNDPTTSHTAAHAAARFCGTHAERLLDAMATRPAHGWTQTELAEATGLGREQVHKRLSDLVASGRTRRDGTSRPGATGKEELCNYLTTPEQTA